jgi:hypothetical protein
MTRLNVHSRIERESPSKDRESVDGVAARGSQSVADLSGDPTTDVVANPMEGFS